MAHSEQTNARETSRRLRGVLAHLGSTDHKIVGIHYGLTALVLLFFAFLLVILIRWQLAYPGLPIPGLGLIFSPQHPWMPRGAPLPEFYNQLVAMHGTLMVFMAVVPLLVGAFGTYLVPLMIGAPNLAFPRLSRAGFWCYVAGALTVLASFFTNDGPASSGWTAYPPLAVIDKSGQTFWLIGIALVYVSTLFLSINIIASVVQLRAPGMRFLRLPFFVWSQLVTAFLLLLAFPPLAAAALMQLMDRLAGSNFFMPSGLVVGGEPYVGAGGGSALLWQHLFWFLAHPEVYVLILPAFGIIAEVIANNTRKPLWGYRGMVAAAWFVGLMSFLVWAHHMFLTGMGVAMSTFFQATTLIISIPSIVLATSLVVSLWGGSIRFSLPMLYALAFLPMFGIGGLTGLPLALAQTNIVLHDTDYVVGHFHYIVAPGTLFAIFAGIYYWFPKVTGKQLDTRLGHLHFWPSLFFMNMIFMPMLIHGVAGVNRRLYDGGATYAHGQDVFFLNKAMTHSAIALAFFQLPFIVNLVVTLWRGARVEEPNPWRATTLEWHAESPPPRGNFLRPPAVYRGPCEYSVPGAASDFSPQWVAEEAE